MNLPFLTAGDSGDPEAGQEAGHEERDKRLGDRQEQLDQVTAEEVQDQAELSGSYTAGAPRRHKHRKEAPRPRPCRPCEGHGQRAERQGDGAEGGGREALRQDAESHLQGPELVLGEPVPLVLELVQKHALILVRYKGNTMGKNSETKRPEKNKKTSKSRV